MGSTERNWHGDFHLLFSAANQDRMLRQKGQEHLVGPPIIRSARTNVDQIGSRGARWELKLKVHAPSGREPLLNTDPS